MGKGTEMLILNINGPMNSGKSTVSKILVNMLPKATFIEVDDLMSDEEQEKMGEDAKNRVLELYSLESVSDSIQPFLSQFIK